MVERRVDEYSRIIPGSRLDTNGFVNEAVLREVLVRNGDSCTMPFR